jgi:hypothetical protein
VKEHIFGAQAVQMIAPFCKALARHSSSLGPTRDLKVDPITDLTSSIVRAFPGEFPARVAHARHDGPRKPSQIYMVAVLKRFYDDAARGTLSAVHHVKDQLCMDFHHHFNRRQRISLNQ